MSGLVGEVLDVQAVLRDLGALGLAIGRIVAIGSFGALTALCRHERTGIARSLIVRVRNFARCTFAGRAAACLGDATPQVPPAAN